VNEEVVLARLPLPFVCGQPSPGDDAERLWGRCVLRVISSPPPLIRFTALHKDI
jgi:hypothetical protein